ncbi:MAG: butyrate kinase [Clostridiales bacterium]|nr:butyrate kinase [Clostridiales bacterium]
MNYKILAVNPGSTSTKVSVYENEDRVFSENVEHPIDELGKFEDILNQVEYRLKAIHAVLSKHGIKLAEISGVAGRGGLLPNMLGGGYLVTGDMTDAIRAGEAVPHASNMGALLASEFAKPLGINAYIYDAVTASEMPEIAMVTGIPEVRKQSMCHVLNMKAMSRKVAKKHGKAYEDLNLIVTHLGGGVSISAHAGGKIIDNLGDDSGLFFAPERSGCVPMWSIIDMCFSGKYTLKEIRKKVRGNGGLMGYFGTSDCRMVEKMIADGDQQAKLVYDAMAYSIAKGIGQLAPVLYGKIDYIILTGGLANSKMLTSQIAERVRFLAPVEIEPGEDEMEALSLGILRILRGEETAKEYQRIKKEDQPL